MHIEKHDKELIYAFFGWLVALLILLIVISYDWLFNEIPMSNTTIYIVLSIFIKFTIRNMFISIPIYPFRQYSTLRDKVMNFIEHVVFSVWAYFVIVIIPEMEGGHGSWLIHPELCWTALPVMPSTSYFWLFYVAKTGTHVEDFIHMVLKYSARYNTRREDPHVIHSIDLVPDDKSPSSPGGVPVIEAPSVYGSDKFTATTGASSQKDMMMDLHHVVTALLCIVSYATGYVKIGSVVMLLHDVSDVPLDLLRIALAMNWQRVTVLSYVAVLGTWLYWRLWILPSVVLKSIIFDAQKSLIFPCSGPPEECAAWENAERGIFVTVLGTLLVLHAVWYYQLVRKGYRMFVIGGSGRGGDVEDRGGINNNEAIKKTKKKL